MFYGASISKYLVFNALHPSTSDYGRDIVKKYNTVIITVLIAVYLIEDAVNLGEKGGHCKKKLKTRWLCNKMLCFAKTKILTKRHAVALFLMT